MQKCSLYPLAGTFPRKLEKVTFLYIGKLLSTREKEEKVASKAVQLELPLFGEDDQAFDHPQNKVENTTHQGSTLPKPKVVELVKV